MLRANDIAINPIVPSHTKTLRIRRSEAGKPIFYHFIYSGYGALVIFTPLIGKSLY